MPYISVQRLYLTPAFETCQMMGEKAFLFASGDDDWGEIPPVEGNDDDDF